MSYYYKFDFISPESSYSLVKEELKSYYDTGAIDDLLFPTYLKKALDRLGKGSYYITDEILDIENFEARLPDNFYSVREAWMCTAINGFPYQNPNSFYSQAASQSTIQVSPIISGGTPCTNVGCTTPNCDGIQCMPELIQSVYKTNNEFNRTFKREYLLKPGNISVKKHCNLHCANFGASSEDSFDIRDNKFVTNFRKGTVYLIFYATEYDDNQNQLMPDNFYIKEYVEAFLKYKAIETLTNQVNDETFNQLQEKLKYYKGLSDEAYILAHSEVRRETVYQKQRAIKRQLNSFQKYELGGKGSGFPWRRNGTF